MEQGSPGLHKPAPIADIAPVAGAEGRGDRPIRRRSRFTLTRARAEPLVRGEETLAVMPQIREFILLRRTG